MFYAKTLFMCIRAHTFSHMVGELFSLLLESSTTSTPTKLHILMNVSNSEAVEIPVDPLLVLLRSIAHPILIRLLALVGVLVLHL